MHVLGRVVNTITNNTRETVDRKGFSFSDLMVYIIRNLC
jgi:hypothetical protein